MNIQACTPFYVLGKIITIAKDTTFDELFSVVTKYVFFLFHTRNISFSLDVCDKNVLASLFGVKWSRFVC